MRLFENSLAARLPNGQEMIGSAPLNSDELKAAQPFRTRKLQQQAPILTTWNAEGSGTI